MSVQKHYDAEGDILYLNFGTLPGPSKGIQLTENIVLRLDPNTGSIVKLVIHNYSRLVALSQNGHRFFSVTGLSGLPPDLSQTVSQALQSTPFNRFLNLVPPASAMPPHLSFGEELLPSEQRLPSRP